MTFVVDRIDHVVLNCRDVDATIDWYVRVLGMRREVFGDNRTALVFGSQKINVRPIGATCLRHDPYRFGRRARGAPPHCGRRATTPSPVWLPLADVSRCPCRAIDVLRRLRMIKERRRGRRPPQGRCRDRPCTRPGTGVSGAHSQLTIAALAFAAGFALHGIAVAEIGTGLVFGYVGLRILRPRGNGTSNIDAGQAHWRRTTA